MSEEQGRSRQEPPDIVRPPYVTDLPIRGGAPVPGLDSKLTVHFVVASLR